jgi:cytochrome c oxidase subunit 1
MTVAPTARAEERTLAIDDDALAIADRDEERRLRATWATPPGVVARLRAIDHKTIGRRYLVTAFTFLVAGGVLAALMRLQLAFPAAHLFGPDRYDQIFTTHGSTMMFLFAVPVMLGMAIYQVPLMIGTRELAYPRLNAYGYWCYLTGCLLLWVSFFLNTGPDAGWFSYVPLAGPQFGPGKRVDVWAQMITFTELSALAVAVNLAATILKQRCPGMSLDRMPLYVWAVLITSIMIIFAMPAVMLDSSMLATDRLIGTQFFNRAEGGDPLLYQHLFWYFAHPEVYIFFLPALGFVSAILAPSTRTTLVGHTAMILSMTTTAFIGFGVWVHHMFATGLPQLGQSFFTASSIVITIPTGVQFFCWLATLWKGRLRPTVPMLYVLGFFSTFVMGGVTGVMLAAVPLNLQLHDTFFVVAHLHYVLIGGAVFPLLGAVHFWFPKLTGRLLDERLGRVSFVLVLLGFHLTFFAMHLLGLAGMPRRVYTYDAATGWGPLNLVATVGAGVLATGLLLTAINVLRALRRPADAPADPWQADGLEWSAASPPAPYDFALLPTVRGRYARWTAAPDQPVVVGLNPDWREVLCTGIMDAEPTHKHIGPRPSLVPLYAAFVTAVTFIGVIFTPWAMVAGALLSLGVLAWWLTPQRPVPHPIDAPPGEPMEVAP